MTAKPKSVRKAVTLASGKPRKTDPAKNRPQKIELSSKAWQGLAEERLIDRFLMKGGAVDVDQVVRDFSMTKSQLAETVGLGREALHKADRAAAAKAQSRLREMLEILSLVEDWAGGKQQALAWYRAQRIPAFGRTAEALVKTGHAAAVRDYLDHIAIGGFA